MHKVNKNSEGFSHIELFVVLSVLALTCTAGIMVYARGHQLTTASSSKSRGTNSPNTSQPTVIADNDTSTQIMGDIRRSLAKRLTILTGNQIPAKAGSISLSTENDTPGGPPLMVSGYNYYVSPNGTSLTIASYANNNRSTPSPDILIIQNILKQEFGTLSPTTVYFEGQPFSAFQNNVAVCYYNADEEPIEINCADKSAYTSTAASMKPLAEAFNTANPTGYKNEFSNLKISGSKTSGYMFATMGTNASIGFFYQKNGTWYLYEDNQSGLSCSFTTNTYPNSNSNDARLAFLGQPCSTSLGSPDSTVQ